MIYHYNNVPIFYEQQGAGPCLILLHGFLESSAIWKKIIPQLTEKFRVLVIDFPGHGLSANLEEPLSMEKGAEIINSILEHLNIDEMFMVGHSMGGYIALAFLEQFSEKVKGVVLMNSTTFADSPTRILNRKKALELVEQNKDSFVSLTIHGLFSKSDKVEFSSEIEMLKKVVIQYSKKGIKNAIKGMMARKDRTNILRKYRGKKLIVTATEDPIIPLEISQDISKQTDSELFTLPGGHMSWLTQDKEIVEILHLIE